MCVFGTSQEAGQAMLFLAIELVVVLAIVTQHGESSVMY